MGIRTGAQYVEGLRQRPRNVWLDGERIGDVSAHPAFAPAVAAIASLYDLQHTAEHSDTLTYLSPTTGDRVATAFMTPTCYDDLTKKSRAHRIFAEATFGMMGRSPDFLNTTLAALSEARSLFARRGQQFADNIVRYYEYIRENDLFLTHALITPQNDRSKTSSEQSDPFLHMGVVRETSEGLIIRGARMLATLGPVADELLVYSHPGLKPGDEKHAVVFAIPIDTVGLKQIAREPFERGHRSTFDHPFATRFEECDTLVVFDDMLVPWDRVFIYNDVALTNAMYPDSNLRQYTAHQTAVRGLVKLETVAGIAMALAASIKADIHLHVQQMLGEIVDSIELLKGCIVRSEIEYETNERGSVRPAFRPLQTARTFMPRAYPRAVEILQTIGAGGLLMLPCGNDFASPIAADVNKYYQGAGVSALERSKLFKLAWDLTGDAFGQRALQYERYYAGDPVRLTAQAYLTYDKSTCERLTARARALAGEPGVTGAPRSLTAAA
jgi:anthranilate 3-monooxygenase (FAD) / 4-hydroxyphenylacetate 3-monooxygenase